MTVDQVPEAVLHLRLEIEERKRVEAALRESEARYRRIVETSEEGISVIDAQARTSFVNPKMACMLGYTVEEMHGLALSDFMDDAAWTLAQHNLERRQQGIAEQHEFRFRRKDGSDLWALLTTNALQDAAGGYAGALAMVTDMTERHAAERNLRASEERFRSLFENSPVCLWEEDLSQVKRRFDELTASGVEDLRAHLANHPEEVAFCLSKVKVLDVNEAAVQLYEAGSKAELLAGLDRVFTTDSFRVLTQELSALAEGQAVFESEGTDQTFTGKQHHVLLKALVAPGCEATLSRVYVSIVDITAHKQGEERRLVLEEQLRHSQKMDAIGQLAGGVAHDFNNLLTVIQGNAAILQVDALSDAQRAEALSQITLASERASALTRQLLTFSRRQVLNPRRLDLNESVAGFAKMLQRLLGEDIDLQLKLQGGPLHTFADPGMLDQVLMNLAVNARDAMLNGGELIIETAQAPAANDESREFLSARPGLCVCLRVTDNGCGIPTENLARIFEPFFTTKDSGKGTGLGLATVFGIVEQHGGGLSVTSSVGRGTTIEVLLPATEAVDASIETDAVEAQGGSESVLLVEDEESVRRLVQRLLEMRGYRVTVANTGADALRLWTDGHDAFDLVITDVVMPGGVSGHDLSDRLWEHRPGLKVLFISGYMGDAAGRGITIREGVNFLQKPFGAARLLECVRACLDGH